MLYKCKYTLTTLHPIDVHISFFFKSIFCETFNLTSVSYNNLLSFLLYQSIILNKVLLCKQIQNLFQSLQISRA